jgi:hypothetical protein
VLLVTSPTKGFLDSVNLHFEFPENLADGSASGIWSRLQSKAGFDQLQP